MLFRQASRDVPLLLAGDFNGSREDPVYLYFKDRGFKSTFATLHGREPIVTHHDHTGAKVGVDYIFYRYVVLDMDLAEIPTQKSESNSRSCSNFDPQMVARIRYVIHGKLPLPHLYVVQVLYFSFSASFKFFTTSSNIKIFTFLADIFQNQLLILVELFKYFRDIFPPKIQMMSKACFISFTEPNRSYQNF